MPGQTPGILQLRNHVRVLALEFLDLLHQAIEPLNLFPLRLLASRQAQAQGGQRIPTRQLSQFMNSAKIPEKEPARKNNLRVIPVWMQLRICSGGEKYS